ncbi:MAG: hypothetical protein ACK4FR_10310 [Tabrizicola sp.]
MTIALFVVALGLSVLAFVVFARIVWTPARPAEPGQGPQIEGVQLPNPGADAEAFAKAGPAATAAALSIFFMFVALLVSGVVELSVDTASEAAAGASG